jgi:uncharacterized iron-regulated membrane protein
MRKWHRWLSFLFGAFILFIAVTGVLSQVGTLVNNGGFEKEVAQTGTRQAAAVGAAIVSPAAAHEHEQAAVKARAAQPGAATAGAAFTCPADMTCRPKRTPKPGEWNVGFLHHIHSGEEFGPAGVILSMASGLALIFFAFSGLWMYIQMFARRSHRKSHPRKVFW